MKGLNTENPVFDWIGRAGDLIILNLLWAVCCIPIVTVGAAQTALYQVMLRRARKKSNYPVREFWEAFRGEFKKSTGMWLGFLAVGAVLVFDIMHIGREWSSFGIVLGCILFIWIILYSYVFPLQARFDNTYRNTLKNAAYMAIGHLPYTVVIVLLNMIPIVCFLSGELIMGVTAPVFFLIGFSVIARINAILFEKIFAKYGG